MKIKSARFSSFTRTACTAVLLCLVIAVQASSSDDQYYPGANWRTATPEEQGLDSSRIADMLQYIVDNKLDIHSVAIIRHGYLVAAADFYPYGGQYMHIIHSCTKSVMSSLVGIAIGDGKLKGTGEKMLQYFPDRQIQNLDSRKKAITVGNLLSMTAGFSWDELTYPYSSPNNTYRAWSASPDLVQFVLDRPMVSVPGAKFSYSTGVSHLLSAIMEKATGMNLREYAKEKLFGPLGITDFLWRSDKNGLVYGGNNLYLTPLDMAKFGYLFLKKGLWNGKQVVPEKWVSESVKKQADVGASGYGYQWWRFIELGGYGAEGYAGQFIFVLPESDIVVAVTSGLGWADTLIPVDLVKYYILPSLTAKSDGKGVERLKKMLLSIRRPDAQAVPLLPPTAKAVSGKTYVMDNPNYDLCATFSLSFAGNDSALLHMVDSGGNVYDCPVGLDSVYRVTKLVKFWYPEPEVTYGAFVGRWVTDTSFEIIFRDLMGIDARQWTFIFTGNTATIRQYSLKDGMSYPDGTSTVAK